MGLWKRVLRFEFRLSYDDDQHDGPALEKRVVNYLEAKVAAGRPAPVAAQLFPCHRLYHWGAWCPFRAYIVRTMRNSAFPLIICA